MSRWAYRARTAGLAVGVTLLATPVVWVVGRPADGAAAQVAPPITVEVSQVGDLVDGQRIDITVRARPGVTLHDVFDNRVQLCRPGETYEAPADVDPTTNGAGKCNGPFSTSAVHPWGNLFSYPDGAQALGSFQVSVGAKTWSLNGGRDVSLACGPDDACLLVTQMVATVDGVANQHLYATTPLAFRALEPLAACGGIDPDAVATVQSDRLGETLVDWSLERCAAEDSPAPTSLSFVGEGEGIAAFARGDKDLVYSAVGYRPGFDPTALTPPAPARPVVPVPVGLNAVVVAVGGGNQVSDASWPNRLPRPHRSDQVKLTSAEVAAIFGQSMFHFRLSYEAAVLARNPEMTLVDAAGILPRARSGAEATTLFASTYLATSAPDQWKVADAGSGLPEQFWGQPRPAFPSFAQATPPFANCCLQLEADRSALAGFVYRERATLGTFYVLTDLATARELGLTPVSLQNAAGDFVAPTNESLAAAVPAMVTQPDGTRLPDPAATTGYPLTFVEYALAPAEPLVEVTTCVPRTATQTLLGSWLEYLTTTGQERLGDALVPLTAALGDEAAAARDRVGTTPSTCQPAGPAPNGPGALPPGSAAGPAGSGSPAGPGGSGPRGSNPGASTEAPTVQAATPETRRAAAEAAREAEVELPPLLGVRALDDLLVPVSLLALVVLTSGVTLVTAGYPARWPDLAGAWAQVRRRRGGGATGSPTIRRWVTVGLLRRGRQHRGAA